MWNTILELFLMANSGQSVFFQVEVKFFLPLSFRSFHSQ